MTIRWSIFRNLILLIGLIVLAISVSTFIIGNRSAGQLSRHIMEQASDIAASSIEPIFQTVRDSLLLFRAFGREGLLQPENPLVMNLMFIPFMTGFAEVSSINTGDANGNGYLILRSDGGWRNRIVTAESVGRTSLWMEWTKQGEPVKEYARDIDYDPRKRPWYILAQKYSDAPEPHVVWTPPYRFFTTNDIGITAAVTVTREDKSWYVLAFDMLLTDISEITARIKPSENGMIALLTEDGKVLGIPRQLGVVDDKERLKQLLLKPVGEIGVPPLTAAFDQWKSEHGEGRRVFSLDVGGDPWWVEIRPLRLGDGEPVLNLVVMVPEHDFLGDLYRSEIFLGLTTVAAVGLALFMAVLLARSYGQPLENLVRESERIQNLDLESTPAVTSNIREVEYLAQAHERMKNVLGSFAKYVPVDVVRTLLARGEAAQLGGVHKVITVLFTDIQGFTGIAESMTPEDLTRHMAEYFGNMLAILKERQATIDKFVGDAIMAFWNAPNDVPDHAGQAVEAALLCNERLLQLNAEWRENGLPELPTRFGIGTGPVVVGNVGAESRLNYTVIGDTVNLASRLEGLNRTYGTAILVARQVREAVGDRLLWRHVDRVAVKGKLEGVDIFEPLGPPSEVEESRRIFSQHYEEALGYYLNGSFSQALEAFSALSIDHPTDLSVQIMVESCKAGMASPQEEWDGVRRLEVK